MIQICLAQKLNSSVSAIIPIITLQVTRSTGYRTSKVEGNRSSQKDSLKKAATACATNTWILPRIGITEIIATSNSLFMGADCLP